LDRTEELCPQFVLAVVVRHKQVVEASVSGGQAVGVRSLSPNIEHQVREAADGCAVTPGRELKELFPLELGEFFVDDLPEPLDN
jgi:hypothetical protein